MTAAHRLLRNQSGNVAIVFALSLPALVGFCGLGSEAVYWYYEGRSLQAAADIAAYNAAVAIQEGTTSSSALTSTAASGATANGWSSGSGTIAVNNPPTTGNNKTSASVEVVLTQNKPRYFTKIFSATQVAFSARAVASASSGACVLALNATAAGAITLSGSANLNSPNCDVISDSNSGTAIQMNGSSQAHVSCMMSAGGASTTAGLSLTKCASVTTHVAPIADPYAGVPTPTATGSCITVSGQPTTLNPGNYCHGLSINWAAPVTFNPGVYYVTGGNLSMNGNANVTGAGVTFFVASGNTSSLNGGLTADLSGPSSGPYAGLVFYGDRTATSGNNNFAGGANTKITGVVYYPTQNVSFAGGGSSGDHCTNLVANTITITGTANFNNACPATGFAKIGSGGRARLVE
jgi:hypothetical protein